MTFNWLQMCAIVELFLGTLVTLSRCMYTEDSCNWTLWGSADEINGVRTVEISCAGGTLKWKHPYGVVRVMFIQHKTPFTVCFTGSAYKAPMQISRQTATGLSPILHITDDQLNNREVCFSSVDKTGVIFLEPILPTGVGQFELDYEITGDDDINKPGFGMQECKPCGDEEIIQAVCTSDFVVKGRIEHVADLPNIGQSHIHVGVQKMHRQSYPVFTKKSDRDKNTQDYEKQEDSVYKGHVTVPHDCRVSKGDGLFVFMGRVRLKQAHLLCAPRYEDFQKLWQTALRKGSNICVL